MHMQLHSYTIIYLQPLICLEQTEQTSHWRERVSNWILMPHLRGSFLGPMKEGVGGEGNSLTHTHTHTHTHTQTHALI